MNTLTGGLGDDTFAPVGTKDVVVADDAGDSAVSSGDVVEGMFDVITDYPRRRRAPDQGDEPHRGGGSRPQGAIYDHVSTPAARHRAGGG